MREANVLIALSFKCIKCPKCNGTGEVTDKFLALMTFGVSLLMDDKDKCPKCRGKGWVK